MRMDEFEGKEEERSDGGGGPLCSSNPGFQLLLAMGWKPGNGLGKSLQGRVAPIGSDMPIPGEFTDTELGMDADALQGFSHHGLGMHEKDVFMHSHERLTVVRERGELAEHVEEKLRREHKEDERLKTLEDQNRKFSCSLCRKQYTTREDYENHLSSYDHHHARRRGELRSLSRGMGANLRKSRPTTGAHVDEREKQRIQAMQQAWDVKEMESDAHARAQSEERNRFGMTRRRTCGSEEKADETSPKKTPLIVVGMVKPKRLNIAGFSFSKQKTRKSVDMDSKVGDMTFDQNDDDDDDDDDDDELEESGPSGGIRRGGKVGRGWMPGRFRARSGGEERKT